MSLKEDVFLGLLSSHQPQYITNYMKHKLHYFNNVRHQPTVFHYFLEKLNLNTNLE